MTNTSSRWWGIMAALFVICSFAKISQAETTDEMLSNCRGVATAKVSGNRVMIPATRESAVCWGAFATLQQITHITLEGEAKPIFLVCPPKDAKRHQQIAIFVRYAENHTERFHEDFVSVALDALRDAFPCPNNP
jgi:predicted secreted protein